MDGASLETTSARKEKRYPELSGQFGRLVVLACEVGGRWSEESSWGTFPSPTKSGGCVVDAMARYHGLQRCQILRSISPRITDVREQ